MNKYSKSLDLIAREIVDSQSFDAEDQRITEVYVEDGKIVVVTEKRNSRV